MRGKACHKSLPWGVRPLDVLSTDSLGWDRASGRASASAWDKSRGWRATTRTLLLYRAWYLAQRRKSSARAWRRKSPPGGMHSLPRHCKRLVTRRKMRPLGGVLGDVNSAGRQMRPLGGVDDVLTSGRWWLIPLGGNP